MLISDREKGPDRESGEYRLLKNPLPEPPRRSHVRMEFDAPDREEDEFDLEIGEEDDFDI